MNKHANYRSLLSVLFVPKCHFFVWCLWRGGGWLNCSRSKFGLLKPQ